jgi:hypothetical protein
VFPIPATLAAAVVTADPNLTPAIQIVLHQHEQAIVNKANTVETDMRRLLLAAYEPVYFEAFAAAQGKAVGQCTVHAQQMLKLKSSYNPAEPIGKYWATINGVVAFVTKHRTAPHGTTVIDAILTSFERDGHFREEAKQWRLKPEAAHILTDFIADITKVHCLANLTAGKAGYHGANAATIAPTANAAASAASAPITPPRKPAAPGATVLADVDNPGKTLTVCYCSVHGMQNASTNKHGSSAHSNKDCPDKATNASWVDGTTLLDRRGGSNKFVFCRQNAPKDK